MFIVEPAHFKADDATAENNQQQSINDKSEGKCQC